MADRQEKESIIRAQGGIRNLLADYGRRLAEGRQNIERSRQQGMTLLEARQKGFCDALAQVHEDIERFVRLYLPDTNASGGDGGGHREEIRSPYAKKNCPVPMRGRGRPPGSGKKKGLVEHVAP